MSAFNEGWPEMTLISDCKSETTKDHVTSNLRNVVFFQGQRRQQFR